MQVIHGFGLAVFVAGCVALGQTQTEEKKADAATQASGSGPRSETPGVYRPEDGVVIPKVVYALILNFQTKPAAKSWEEPAFFPFWWMRRANRTTFRS